MTLPAARASPCNGVYQLVRKPTELFFPVSGALYKTPSETWRPTGRSSVATRRRASSAELLAALAQVEASGNPLVRTYWRWVWPATPFDFYRPASSAVGMYQITDRTFQEARHYCIHRSRSSRVRDPGTTSASCWFNALYLRVLPADAMELTAADSGAEGGTILRRRRAQPAPGRRSCAILRRWCTCAGPGAAAAYARRGYRFSAAQCCGEHDPRQYLERVDAFGGEFARLARGAPRGAQ